MHNYMDAGTKLLTSWNPMNPQHVNLKLLDNRNF